MSAQRIALTDFAAQVRRQNTIRVSSGLPLLKVDAEADAARRQWLHLIEQARAQRRAELGDQFADNWISRLAICYHIEGQFRAYIDGLAYTAEDT